MRKIVVFGEALIDFVPEEKGVPLKDVAAYYRRAGGAPANVAAAVARMGGRVTFFGQVGQDAFGEHIREVLTSCGVDTSGLRQSACYPTALAFVTLNRDGERDFFFVRGESADLRLREEEVPPDVMNGAYCFHFGSNLFMDEQGYQLSLALLRRAKAGGLLVSYDPNLRPPLWPGQRVDVSRVLSVVEQVDILKVSEEELFVLTGLSADGDGLAVATEQLAAMGPGLTIVTLGERGCYYRQRTGGPEGVRTGWVPGRSVQAVDTTGAGDAFVGAFLYRLSASAARPESLSREELEAHLRFAAAAGALTTLKPGAIDGIPDRAQVERFLAGEE